MSRVNSSNNLHFSKLNLYIIGLPCITAQRLSIDIIYESI